MAYTQCHACKTVVHFKPVDLVEFNKRFVNGSEPIYCLKCFKERETRKQS